MRAITVRLLWDEAKQKLSVEIDGRLTECVDIKLRMRLIRNAMAELSRSAALKEQTTLH